MTRFVLKAGQGVDLGAATGGSSAPIRVRFAWSTRARPDVDAACAPGSDMQAGCVLLTGDGRVVEQVGIRWDSARFPALEYLAAVRHSAIDLDEGSQGPTSGSRSRSISSGCRTTS